MSAESPNARVDSGEFLAATITHGRSPGGMTGHIVCASSRQTLCGVEKRARHLDLVIFEADDLEEAGPLSRWISAGAAYLCGTCVRRIERKLATKLAGGPEGDDSTATPRKWPYSPIPDQPTSETGS